MKTLAALRALTAVVLLVPGAGRAETVAVQNDQVRVALDSAARLAELTNRHSGWNYASGARVWRLFYREGDRLDAEAVAPTGGPKILADASAITVRYDRLETRAGQPLEIALEYRVRLVTGSDDVQWSATIENHQSGLTVTELQFPLVGNCQLQSGQALIWSNLGGQRTEQPLATVRAARSEYMASDQNGVKMAGMYPGVSAAMNCFVFAGPKEGLYFGSHDPSLQNTLHLFRALGDALEAGFVKYPFLAARGTFTTAPFVLSPYAGTWHVAARKYRRWADTWFSPPRQPDWVRRMTGWQRIILKHQYGEVLHPYATISRMADDGLSAGVGSLLLFGWWKGGMDGGYPEYAFDENLGGRETLVAQIRAAQRRGARIHLYFNGRLIDKESEFYRSGDASRISIKDLRGNEHNESYHFSGDGTTAWQFGRKTFVVACPASAQWQQKRLALVDRAIDLGVDAVFFDQLGINEAPCTDPRHGHPVPLLDQAQIRTSSLREIRQRIKSRSPEVAFGTEILCDVVAAQADYLHGLTGARQTSNADWQRTGQRPRLTGFIEWFRYTFPEVIVSDRENRDDLDVQWKTNLSLIRGLRNDVEIWRCRGTVADAPHYREQLAKTNALREKYARFFLEGRYRDTELFHVDSAEVEARCFESGDELLVVATQSHCPKIDVAIDVPGYRLLRWDGLGEYRADAHRDAFAVTLNRHAVAVGIFQKRP
jgi:hypothetical protein